VTEEPTTEPSDRSVAPGELGAHRRAIAFAIIFVFVWKWVLPAVDKRLAARQRRSPASSPPPRRPLEAESLLADYKQQVAPGP
jgi:F0F1-type ATP synthase membrane subunit b/b'